MDAGTGTLGEIMTKDEALACLQGHDHLKEVSALLFLEVLDRAENAGVIDTVVAMFGINYYQYHNENKVRMLKVIGKHLEPNDPPGSLRHTEGSEYS